MSNSDERFRLEFAGQLRRIRKLYGYTQQEVAEKIYMNRSAYTYYETGKVQPGIETLIRLADLYDISVDCLLGRRKDWSDKELAYRIHLFFNQYLQEGEKDNQSMHFFRTSGHPGKCQVNFNRQLRKSHSR